MTTPKATGRERQNLRRERRRRGWSENDAAIRLYNLGTEHGVPEDQLGVDARAVSRWELGKTQPNQTYTALLSLLYEVPPEHLDLPPLVLPVGSPQPPTVAAVTTTAPADLAEVATAESGAVDSDPMRRREFIKLGGLGVVALAGGFDLERLASILAGTRVDASGLDHLEALTGDLMRREATLAPHALLPAVRGHLQGLHEMLVWTPSSLAPRAYSLAGQTALLAGYLRFKEDNHADADAYWGLAHRYGHVAGDERLRAAILVLQGWRWHDEDMSLAITLLDRAESLLGKTPEPVAAAEVLSMRGRRHAEASKGDPAHGTLALRDVDTAQAHLSRLRTEDSTFYIFESVKGEVSELRALTFLSLDRPKEAVAELESLLLAIGPESLSWRSYATTSLATAHADMHDPERACELLVSALQLAERAAAQRCIHEVRSTRHRWPQLAEYDGPSARRLDERLRALAAPKTPHLASGWA
jgi:hypothetical protein